MKSLALHANLRNGLRNDAMDKGTAYFVRERILEELRDCKWTIPEDFMEYSHYERAVKTLDWTSSPGYPYLLRYPTNKIFFEEKDGQPSKAALQRLWITVQNRLDERESDPIRLFVKPEPLTRRKLEADKFRLISSVSVVDQIIDSMLFDGFNSAIIKNCDRTPIKAGWTPYLGGWKQVPVGGVVSTDKSSWDWTVQPWILEEAFDIVKKLCTNVNEDWLDLVNFRIKELFMHPKFVTSGGLLLEQRKPGVMKSGCKVTITINSLCQMILHYRVAELKENMSFMWAMGDDVIQSPMSTEYFDRISEFCILKEISKHVEFAGFRFTNRSIQPLYLNKHSYMILHQDEKYHEETSVSYMLLYHRSTIRKFWNRILQQLNANLLQEQFYDLIWDGGI